MDSLLTELATHAIVREPQTREGAPDPADAHVWSLVQSETHVVLVTGDRALLENPPPHAQVLAPRELLAEI